MKHVKFRQLVHEMAVMACTMFLVACLGSDNAVPVAPMVPMVTTVRVMLADTVLVVGRTTQANAQVLDQSGGAMSGKTVTWRSTDSTVAAVSVTGLVTARKDGTVIVIASVDNRDGAANLRTMPQVATTVRVTLADSSVIVGEKTQASASVLDQVGNSMSSQAVTWTTSNPTAASIDSTGRINTLLIGQAQVTATAGAATGQAALRITPDPETATKYRAMGIGWYSDAQVSKFTVEQLKRDWIDRAVDLGYNAVQFMYNVDVNDDGSLSGRNVQTKMLALTDYARQRGLKVLWQVYWVYASRGAAGYVGNVDCTTGERFPYPQYNCQPAAFDKLRFLKAVDEYWSAQAAEAQARGVSLLLIGSRLRVFTKPEFREQWGAVVAHIRARFSGLVSFQTEMMWYSGWPRIGDFPMWDLMDFIGPTYNPQLTGCIPVYDVNDALQLHFETSELPFSPVKELFDVSRKYGKPVMLSRVQYAATPCALSGMDDPNFHAIPNTIESPNPFDQRAQTVGLQAFLELANKNLTGLLMGYVIGGYEPWEYGGPFIAGSGVSELTAFQMNRMKFYDMRENPVSEQMVSGYLRNRWGFHTTTVTNGSAGDDILYVNSGTNSINPRGGIDEVHGGTGLDTVILTALYTACTVTTATMSTPSVPAVQVRCGTNVVKLWNVEYMRFSDQTIPIPPNSQ